MNSQTKLPVVGICGIGQMGAAAAVAFKRAGYRVLLWARNPQKLQAVAPALEELEEWTATHLGPASRAGGAIELEPNLHRLDADQDALLECILEVMEQKVALLRQLTKSRERGALFLSVTSGLSITEMARASGCEKVLAGAHFWNPPHLIPVVEMVQGEKTPEPVMARACELMKDIGKAPVRCKDVPGFVGNRLMHAMWREALALVDAGVCTAEDIDRVVKLTFALRLPALGPMENMDLVGLDAVQRIHKYLLPDLATNRAPSACLDQKVGGGQLGMKSGRGFYDWKQRDSQRTVRNRDLQIVRQMQFLKEVGDL